MMMLLNQDISQFELLWLVLLQRRLNILQKKALLKRGLQLSFDLSFRLRSVLAFKFQKKQQHKRSLQSVQLEVL